MAYFPRNFINGIAIKIQCSLSIPWLKKNSGIICCAKGRNYSSSVPVKYTPKRFSKNEENVTYLQQERNNVANLNIERGHFSKNSSKNLVDIESNNLYELNLEVEEEIEGDLTAVNEEFIDEPDNIVEGNGKRFHGKQLGHTQLDVEKLAIELLSSRAYTAQELKKKLQGKKVPLEIIDAVITDLQNRGLINDGLYAETYSRSRWSSSSWGPRRIKQALFKKGVSEADSQKAIKLVFENDENSEDQVSGISMSKLSIDQLYVQASKQWQRSRGLPQETRKSRIVRWLQYRGFNWSVISYVLKKLDSGSPQ